MKIYIICCVPVQIFYLRKMLFLRYRPKCSQPRRLRDFKLSISPEQIDEQPHLLHVDSNSQKFKVDLKVFGGTLSKMSVANLASIL